MEDVLNQLIALLGGSGHWVGYLAAALLFLFRDRVLDKLGVKPKPADPVEPDEVDDEEQDETDAWLEEHPLLDRLWKRLKEKFADKVLTGEEGEDEVYAELLVAIRDYDADADAEYEEESEDE